MQHNNHVSPSRAGSSSGHGRSPAPRAVPGIPKRQVETIDEEADEDEDESAGLLNSGWQRQRPGYTASLVLQRWPWLVLSLCVVVGTIYTLRSPTRADTTQHSPTLGAHAVQELEAAIQKQREQLLSLQSRLAAGGGGATGGCVDSWAVQYPLELEMWDGHSCAWKKKWGQCNEFAKHCAQTCGICTGPVARNRGGAAAGAPVSVVSEPAPQPQIVTESEEEDDPDLVEEVDGDPDDELPAATPKQTTTPPAERPTTEQQRARQPRVANAADIVPVVTAEDDGGHVDADARFVGGARSQADVVQRLKRSRRPQQRPAPQKLAYGDEPDNSKSDNIDDTYEGPQSASDASSQSAALNADETPEAARARYVAGDPTSVISPGSECGIPIREPAVKADFVMAAFKSKPSNGPKGRRYSEVTYLSSVVTLHAGEVGHLVQGVKLQRPEGAIGVSHYAVELMQQDASELRPARDGAVHLKRLALQPGASALDGSRRGRCSPPPLIVVGEGTRRTQVRFPHPFGLLPNASDAWTAEVHLVRTEGLAAPAEQAQQCVCMREDIGSVHCCPHSCRYASKPGDAAGATPASYRVSLVLTWLLGGDDGEGKRSALRPLTAMWVPVGGEGASFSAPRPLPAGRCRRVAATDFDCADGGRCASTRYGPWLRPQASLLAVTALPIGAPRVRKLALVSAKAEDAQKVLCHSEARGEAEACSLTRAATATVQARAELQRPAKGVDAGWTVWAWDRAAAQVVA